jgi:hypothetical protein
VEIKLTAQEIKDMLLVHIKSPHSKLVADIIIGNLAETEVGLKQLFMAMQGVFKPVEFEVGQAVFVKPHNLYDWRFNKDLMAAHGYLVNGLVPGVITEINPHKEKRVTVSYNYIDKEKGDKDTVYSQDVDEKFIQDGSDDFF